MFFLIYVHNLSQVSQYRTVSAGTASIYRTGKQTGTVNPPVSYRKKYRPYRSISGNTGQYAQEKKFFFYYYYFLSFVIFEFLLGQNSNLFALIY